MLEKKVALFCSICYGSRVKIWHFCENPGFIQEWEQHVQGADLDYFSRKTSYMLLVNVLKNLKKYLNGELRKETRFRKILNVCHFFTCMYQEIAKRLLFKIKVNHAEHLNEFYISLPRVLKYLRKVL